MKATAQTKLLANSNSEPRSIAEPRVAAINIPTHVDIKYDLNNNETIADQVKTNKIINKSIT